MSNRGGELAHGSNAVGMRQRHPACRLSFVQMVRLLDKTQAALWKTIAKIDLALPGALLC
jgi:hypothetical protein